MAFSEKLEHEGWTILVLSPTKAIEFSFRPDSDMATWLSNSLPKGDWQQVSFRKLAFRNLGSAILFKLTCC
jgi:hypothetical protein